MTAQTRQAIVQKVEDLSSTVRAIHLLQEGGKPFPYRPGQWVSLLPGGAGHRGGARAYSIASSGRKRVHFELCVKPASGEPGADPLWQLKVGDRIEFSGPHGKFVLREPVEREALFVATGTGIAPFRSMLQEAVPARSGHRLTLLFGGRSEADLLYRREWEEMEEKHPEFRYIPTLSKPGAGWIGRRGYVQEMTPELLRGRPDIDVYICGQRRMVTAVRDQCREWAIPGERVHFETYGG